MQATVREAKTAAETAKANLASSERSWDQQKQMLQKEVDELKDRCVLRSQVRGRWRY